MVKRFILCLFPRCGWFTGEEHFYTHINWSVMKYTRTVTSMVFGASIPNISKQVYAM
jgi:hypothetical protein